MRANIVLYGVLVSCLIGCGLSEQAFAQSGKCAENIRYIERQLDKGNILFVRDYAGVIAVISPYVSCSRKQLAKLGDLSGAARAAIALEDIDPAWNAMEADDHRALEYLGAAAIIARINGVTVGRLDDLYVYARLIAELQE